MKSRHPRWGRFLIFLCLLTMFLGAAIVSTAYWRYPYPFRPVIEREAEKQKLDPLLVAAVIREESRFRPLARSNVGAVGLMQLMPQTANWLEKGSGDRLQEPETNIALGCRYLRYLRNKHSTWQETLAAYNAGQGNVSRWEKTEKGLHIPYPETQAFVGRVWRSYQRYQLLYGSDPLWQRLYQGISGTSSGSLTLTTR